jgi:hypothetical protein
MQILGRIGRLVTERWGSKVSSGFLRFPPFFCSRSMRMLNFSNFDQSNLVIFYHILTEVKVEMWETFFFLSLYGHLDRPTNRHKVRQAQG